MTHLMQYNPQWQQHNDGLACLAYVFRYYQRELPLELLYQLAYEEMEDNLCEGGNLYTLFGLAQLCGFEVEGSEATYEALLSERLPFIVHHHNFFKVVCSVDDRQITLMNTETGLEPLEKETFETGWAGIMLSLSPGEVNTAELLAARNPEDAAAVDELHKKYQAKLIATGGQGHIYCGMYEGKETAIKYRPGYRNQMNEANTFKQEMEIFQQLKTEPHPGIIDVYEMDHEKHLIFLEWAKGSSIYYQPKQIPWVRALAWMKQVAAALQHLHQLGFLHCDIKPQNILLTDQNQVKLIDFGAVQPINQENMTSKVYSQDYMTPEQAQEQTLTTASDLYQWALVLLELISGADTQEERTEMLKQKDKLQSLCHSEEAARKLLRCFAQDPKQRPSFAEILQL